MEDANEINRNAVIEAAYRYAAKPESSSRSRALIDAVRRLEAGTCPASGVGGDPSWPYMLRCTKPVGHEEYHQDPRGPWRERN